MRFTDIIDYSFNYSDAEQYTLHYWDQLDAIYQANAPESGTKGAIWRQFHGRPHNMSVLTVFLCQKLHELEQDLATSKKQVRQTSREFKNLKVRAEDNEKILKSKQEWVGHLEDENTELKSEIQSRLDNDTARALMESISLLATKCKEHNIHIDVNDLPHRSKVTESQINYLKSLVV